MKPLETVQIMDPALDQINACVKKDLREQIAQKVSNVD